MHIKPFFHKQSPRLARQNNMHNNIYEMDCEAVKPVKSMKPAKSEACEVWEACEV